MHILHRSDLLTYLNSLILKERDSLLGYSATIKDLIHICEHKIKSRKLVSRNKFTTDETDIWIPSLHLGIEVRNSWENSQLTDLLFLLQNTLSSKGAKPKPLSALMISRTTHFIALEKLKGRSKSNAFQLSA